MFFSFLRACQAAHLSLCARSFTLLLSERIESRARGPFFSQGWRGPAIKLQLSLREMKPKSIKHLSAPFLFFFSFFYLHMWKSPLRGPLLESAPSCSKLAITLSLSIGIFDGLLFLYLHELSRQPPPPLGRDRTAHNVYGGTASGGRKQCPARSRRKAYLFEMFEE